MEYFHWTVCEAGGDGAAVICCLNPEETADFFIEWWKKKYLKKMQLAGYKLDEFYHERTDSVVDGGVMINYHDCNENFMFCDRRIELGHGDVSFVVAGDCETFKGDFAIRALA